MDQFCVPAFCSFFLCFFKGSVSRRYLEELANITVLNTVEEKDVKSLINLSVTLEKLKSMRPLVWNELRHKESVFHSILLLTAIQKFLVPL